MRVAVIGATGVVGRKMVEILEERKYPVTELIPVASEKSAGKSILFKGKEWNVKTLWQALESYPEMALFSAGSEVSKIWAPKFAAIGCFFSPHCVITLGKPIRGGWRGSIIRS